MYPAVIRNFFGRAKNNSVLPAVEVDPDIVQLRSELKGTTIGLIAGSGPFPLTFINEARRSGCDVVAACHVGESLEVVAQTAKEHCWVKVGELGKIIKFFKKQGVSHVAMAGAIDRVRLFENVSLDVRGASMIFRVRSMKDDLLMRGIAEELAKDQMTVVPCTLFLSDQLAPNGVLTKRKPSKEELEDIEIGRSALKAMSNEHIGQTVVVCQGVVVAVEAVEGTDRCIARGGELGSKGCVVVKCAKVNQDMRFDVPTIGIATIESLEKSKATVLAVEAERTLILDKEDVVSKANSLGISIIGVPRLNVE